MSDTLARVSEVEALQCSDVEPDTLTSGGTVHIRASKTDQRGDGSTRYIGPATLVAVGRYQVASGQHLRAAVPPAAAQRPKQRRAARSRQHPNDRTGAHRSRDRRRGAHRRAVARYAGGLHSPRGRRARAGRAAPLRGRAAGVSVQRLRSGDERLNP